MDDVMDPVVERSAAERVRTVLARGATGSMEAGLLRRPLRSARVRDGGTVALLVDVGGMSREVGDAARVAAVGATATVEIVDTVCTGRCRSSAPRPSFALDGRPSPRTGPSGPCDDDDDNTCAVSRGIITLTGIVTASSAVRRRRLVGVDADARDSAADHAGADGRDPVVTDSAWSGPGGEGSALRSGELQPLEITYVSTDGVSMISRVELATAAVDPIGVDEQAWLRRLAANPGLAARLALRSGRQIAGTDPWIVGLDRFGVDLAIDSVGGGVREVVRLPFSQVCRDSDDVQRELAALA